MLVDVFNKLFGCRHNNCSFPRTTKAGSNHPAAANATGTYVVCLDCGQEFPYDWNQMKVLSPEEAGATPIAAKPLVRGYVGKAA